MSFLQKIWNFLNGNKTFFGMFILLFLQQGWISDYTFLYEFLAWVGQLLTGVGVAHKLIKSNTQLGAN